MNFGERKKNLYDKVIALIRYTYLYCLCESWRAYFDKFSKGY